MKETIHLISALAIVVSLIIIFWGFDILSAKMVIAGFAAFAASFFVNALSSSDDTCSIFGDGWEYGGW